MKLNTHYIFSAGLISLVLSLFFKINFFNEIMIALSISYIGNNVIDLAGHKEVTKNFREMLVRTEKTHTFPRSVTWGLLSSLPIFLFVIFFSYYYLDLYDYTFFAYVASVIIAGIIVGPSHMLLDMFTGNGIYVKKQGIWQRFALAHRKFNDPLANNTAKILGVVMLLLSFWEYYSGYVLHLYHLLSTVL